MSSMDQPERCDICGEQIKVGQEISEMYDPAGKYEFGANVLCHAQCGLSRGLEPA